MDQIDTLPLWASFEDISPIIGIRDRRAVDKLPIRKTRLASRIVRYNTRDLKNLIEKRTIGKAVEV